MYACILIPRELSLVLSLHPNPTHMLEMSAAVWSNTHLSPGTIFYPDEGEVRLDRIEGRIAIPDEDCGQRMPDVPGRGSPAVVFLSSLFFAALADLDASQIRRFYGCYDTVLNINGQEVRHCNWVRFVKSTAEPNDANIISSKVRGQSFYLVIRPINPNEEIKVLFHLNLDRTLHERQASMPFASYSPSMNLPQSYIEASLFGSQSRDNNSVMTSTPLPTKAVNRHSFTDDLRGQRRLLHFGSSSSSSSFASPQFDSPNNDRCQRNNPRESSFTSPMCSSSSSRETSNSDKQSRHSTTDASFLKESSPEERTSPKRGTPGAAGDTEDVNGQTCWEENEDRTSPTCDNDDQSQEPDVDVVSEANPDGSEDDRDDLDSVASVTDDEDVASGSDNVSRISEGHKDTSSPMSPPQPTGPTLDSPTEFPSSLPPPVQEQWKNSSPPPDKSRLDIKQEDALFTEAQQPVVEKSNKLPVFAENQSTTAADAEDQIPPLRAKYQDISSDEKDNFSSPNEARPLSYMLPPSPRSVRALDLHQAGALDHPQWKRCRERTWWPCDVCGKKFDRPSLLKRHTRTHTGEKPHACDVCGKAFSTSSSLNTHKRIHSGEKPHQCKTCGKRFTASSNLYYHRMTHNKEKPHKCDLCSKSFPTPGDLRSHMYIHNGSWPYRCAVCNRGFSKQTNLKNHMLLHSGDKPHECSRCGKKFALLCNLKTHIKTHDNSDLSDCIECLKCGSAMDISDDQETVCKRCSGESHPTNPKPSLAQSSKKRHTDFSISKLTSPDVRDDDLRDKPLGLVMSSGAPRGNMKTLGFVNSAPPFLNSPPLTSHHFHMSAIYRQFFPTSDQHNWLVPPSPQLLATQFLPGMMKHPMAFPGSTVKNGHEQPVPSVAHTGIPVFVTPDMLSLPRGSVFPAAASGPGSFPMHHGSATLGGHVMTQGF